VVGRSAPPEWATRTAGLLLSDLLGRSLLGRSLFGGRLLGRGLLGDSLLGLLGGPVGLLRQLDADQLGGTLADRAGLRGNGAQGLLGQLDSLVDVALGTRRGVVQTGLAAQALESGLAALDQLGVARGRRLDVAFRGAAQLIGGEPLAQLTQLLGYFLLQLGQAGTALLDPAAGVRAGLFGALTELTEQVVDCCQGQVSGAQCSKQRGLQVVDGRVVVVRHGWFLSSFSLCVSGLALGFPVIQRWSPPGQPRFAARRTCRCPAEPASAPR